MSTMAGRTTDPVVLDRNSRLRFLLIEDSKSDSELIRALLEDEFPHTKVDEATSLELALQHLAAAQYDLILADLTLPDADGGTVVRTVRDAYPKVTLMVLTGRVDGSLALWALAAGAQDYLVKGQHDGPHLAESVLHGLQRSRTEQLTHSLLLASLSAQGSGGDQTRDASETKSDFVATVSHELRTPLTSITAYAELLQDDPDLSPRQAGFVDAIARNAVRLRSLTDDLLVLSGFASMEHQMQTQVIDVREVVAQAREVILSLRAGRGIIVDFVLPEEPLFVTGDAAHLERVVLNLVGNAIKFSEQGGTVVCRLRESRTEVVLEVSDTGIGIPLDEQHGLFTKFFRGSAAREHAVEGTGLGLHIVASIVKNHGGNISVDSDTGRGTRVTVRLPRRVTDADNPEHPE
ncbi:MAG: Response regulator receiver protein [Nocardioides sp.]|jgi:signal transduction histidine kinase|uniref:ATP-binding response regulator n=1 Tax=Nocardioides sp. TaxID=35761 RepID=UPI002601FBC2|nr:hybrid sensor histidine kinase/response regulator [Nocardioides sp.]MCW2834478.1 Response regulator receiver protein [Nocardioides sp.]